MLALGLAAVQLAPLPAPLAARLSPPLAQAYSRGRPPRPRSGGRSRRGRSPSRRRCGSPVTLDRSATLRWLAGAAACLALFWGVVAVRRPAGAALRRLGKHRRRVLPQHGVRRGAGGLPVGGLFGFFEPGKGPCVGPVGRRPADHPQRVGPAGTGRRETRRTRPGRSPVPDRPFLFGSLMGGPGAYLALGSLGLPLALALVLQLLAPRGSREGLADAAGRVGAGEPGRLALRAAPGQRRAGRPDGRSAR